MTKTRGLAAEILVGEDGATMVEYALLITLIAMACIVAVTSLGTSLKAPFQHAINGLS